MDTSVIYYFSGTGNSYYVAKKLAAATDATLLPITSLDAHKHVSYNQIGFVFPSYDFKPPAYVKKVIENLDTIDCQYLYAVCTYGVALSKALYQFDKTLTGKGARLNAGFGIKMPHNAVGSYNFSDEAVKSRLIQSYTDIEVIITKVQNQYEGRPQKTSVFEDGTLIRLFPMLMGFLFKLVTKGAKGLSFKTWDACNSCGQCVRICPVNNIASVDGIPVFGDACTGCFACLQWCPKRAIHIGNYGFDQIKIKAYHHPDVSPSELIQIHSSSPKR